MLGFRNGRIWQGWQRLTKTRRVAVIIALVALIVANISVAAFVIHPAGASTQANANTIKKLRSDPRAAAQYNQLRHYGRQLPTNPKALAQGRASAAKLPQLKIRSAAHPDAPGDSTGTWTPLGPTPINYNACTDPNVCSDNYGTGSGRVTALAVDPTDSDNLWVGSADGGVWHSTDGGANYTPVSDTWATNAIGAIAIDPSNHNTIYVGTGEGNLNGDAFSGAGIYKTTNGGATWTQLSASYTNFAGMGFTKLAVDPFNSNNVLAAVTFAGPNTPPDAGLVQLNGGVWRSTDGGNSWSIALSDPNNGSPKWDFGSDVVFDTAHSGVVYGAISDTLSVHNNTSFLSHAGVYKSTDSGVHWSQLNLTLPSSASSADIERVALGLSSDGTTLYAALVDGAVRSGSSNLYGSLLGNEIWVSTNLTAFTPSFTTRSVPTAMATAEGGYQYWYDLYAAVDPTNSNVFYVGGVDIYRTPDGGTNWFNVTNAYGGGSVHPDQHAVAFQNGSANFYVGNDGGVWKDVPNFVPSPATDSLTNLNGGGLSLTQFYSGSYGDVGGASGTLYGGSQDNGEAQYTGTSFSGPAAWNETFGGDGGDTAVDYTNNNIVYEEYVFGNISKTTNGGATWSVNPIFPTTAAANDPVNFIMPYVMSPTSPATLYAGTDRVWVTTNGGSSWAAKSPHLDGQPISAVAVAPNNASVIYAGTNLGDFFYTTNNGTAWKHVGGYSYNDKTHAAYIPDSNIYSAITSIAVDPTNAATVYVALNAFGDGAGQHVYKSTNNGSSWTDISRGLPNVPFESILVNPNNNKLLIAGSDGGIFASPDGGATWARLGQGLPNVAVDQVFASHDGSKLFVATHGRGMYELSSPYLSVTPGGVSGTVAPGGAVTKTLTVTNKGFAPLNWSVTETGAGSITSGPTSGTLLPKASSTLTVTVPTTTAGVYNGNLHFTGDGLIATQDVPVAVVAKTLSKTWFFAEGHTGNGFTEYLTIANPSASSATVTVKYLIRKASAVTKSYTVGANTRFTLNVGSVIGSPKDVSLVVTSTQPIIAERPMYFIYAGMPGPAEWKIPGGTDVLGATSLRTDFFFGYADTSALHDTWLTILNQNNATMTATISLWEPNGTLHTSTTTVGANTRGTVKLNGIAGLPASSYTMKVHLSIPGLVERPMYLVDMSVASIPGATDYIGVPSPQADWYFADGLTGFNAHSGSSSEASERYILANPGSGTVHATVTFYKTDGTTVTTTQIALGPGQQQVVDAKDWLAAGDYNGAHVNSSDGALLADRFVGLVYDGPVGANHFAGIGGVTDTPGTTTPGQAYYFAEGYSGNDFAEYLELVNPGDTTATVTVSYLPTNASTAPTVLAYTVAPHQRVTVFANVVMVSQSFSMTVISDQPIVAERTLDFIYNGTTIDGSNAVVGYQP